MRSMFLPLLLLSKPIGAAAQAAKGFLRWLNICKPRPSKSLSQLLLFEGRVSPNMYVTMCYEIEGYNYEAGNPEGGYSWVEDAGCSTTYVPDDSGTDGGGGGGGGGLSGPDYGSADTPSSNGSVPTIAVDQGPNMIGNINEYLGYYLASCKSQNGSNLKVMISRYGYFFYDIKNKAYYELDESKAKAWKAYLHDKWGQLQNSIEKLNNCL